MTELKPKNKRRSRRFHQRKRRRMPINVAASVITTFSVYCGIASILAAIRTDYDVASYWILAAIVSDMLDGMVARLTKSVSDFGKELDSMADMVSFGVAPAVLIYSAYLRESDSSGAYAAPMGSMVATLFVICTALRLARYNIFQSERQDLFIGLPSPAAAGTIASFTLFARYFELNVAYWVLGPLTIALAGLMVSTIRYPRKTMQVFVLAPRKAFRFLVLCVVGISVFNYALQYSPAIVLLPLGMTYVLFGAVNELYVFLRRRGLVPAVGASEEVDKEATTRE